MSSSAKNESNDVLIRGVIQNMKWSESAKGEILEGTLVKRYKRFFADFTFENDSKKPKIEVAHVPNTGSLKSVLMPGQKCLLTKASDPNRKLKYTLEALQVENGSWVGVNTSWPNSIIKQSLELKMIADWKPFDEVHPEYKISKETRLDFYLKNTKSGEDRYIEVKNVSLKIENAACFPDAVTERGQKHLRELIDLKQKGHQAEIVFFVQRTDCEYFRPADEIDPIYGKLLREANKARVIISAFQVEISKDGIQLNPKKMKVQL